MQSAQRRVANPIFINLLDYKIKENIGWIAPKIYSQSLHFDFNPQAKHRYSLRKLKALRLMFKYPWLLRVKQRLLHQYHDIKNCPLGKIYAGHGSFIILTKMYFQHCGIINYPVFLYGEELFLAEECLHHGLQVIYNPNITVLDIGKVSTGNIPPKTYCRYNFEGIDYIITTYYSHH